VIKLGTNQTAAEEASLVELRRLNLLGMEAVLQRVVEVAHGKRRTKV